MRKRGEEEEKIESEVSALCGQNSNREKVLTNTLREGVVQSEFVLLVIEGVLALPNGLGPHLKA